MQKLTGHTSEQTAYVVDDYPYGYVLRCKIRYWIETTKRGQRFCSQTTNPKRSVEFWNKPKKSTYSDHITMYLNEDNHVTYHSISIEYRNLADWEAYIAKFGLDLASDPVLAERYKMMKIVEEARKHIKIEIAKPAMTPEEADAREEASRNAPRRAFAYALHKYNKGEL